jgi:bifunctional UDP-N-acetylglucosamine pyrophosphorylase/glucosamine-1-phosphate N-acetyltransferase
MRMDQNREPAAIVMAAGKSKRMKSELPKVLHELCGQPLLWYILEALEGAAIRRKLVVVGHQADRVRAQFAGYPGVEFIDQGQQLGTGHAVAVCRNALAGHVGPVIVLAGDMPMIRNSTLHDMLQRFFQSSAAAYLATAVVGNPFGMGRIVRDEQGAFVRIVEQRDATAMEAQIREINPSFYVFDGPKLFDALTQLRIDNASGEYYLTDVPGILVGRGERVVAEPIADEADVVGINERRHLAEAHTLMQERIHQRLSDEGVTIVDSRNTYVDARAIIGPDCVLYPCTVIHGPVEIGRGCKIGPFAHVREHCKIGDGAYIGAFVEVVRSEIGAGTVAKHLTYLGDSRLGESVNVGAGVITANYDGKTKSVTKVDDHAFLGCGSILIAPVTVGPRAMVGAGAVVTKNHDIPPDETVFGVPARPARPNKAGT